MTDKAMKDQNIISTELIRNFLLTSLVDIAMLLVLSSIMIIAILVIDLAPSYLLYASYFILILTLYFIYIIALKPKMPGKYFKTWNYFEEDMRDSSDIAIKYLTERINFMKSAAKYIDMRMGELNSTFWNNYCYINALKELINRDVSIRIIARNKFDVESKEIVKLAIEGKIKIYLVETELLNRKLPGHFILNEKGNLWTTEPRPPFSEKRKGRYTLGSTKLSKEKKEIFDELIANNATLLNKETIKDVEFLTHGPDGKPTEASEYQIKVLFDYLGLPI